MSSDIPARPYIRFACISYAGHSRRFAGGSREASRNLGVHDMRDGVLCVTGALGASFDDVCFSSVVRLDENQNLSLSKKVVCDEVTNSTSFSACHQHPHRVESNHEERCR